MRVKLLKNFAHPAGSGQAGDIVLLPDDVAKALLEMTPPHAEAVDKVEPTPAQPTVPESEQSAAPASAGSAPSAISSPPAEGPTADTGVGDKSKKPSKSK